MNVELLDPALIVALAEAVRAAGGRALFVGGCVRDALMAQPIKDMDIEVFGIVPDRLRKLLEQFGQVDCVGAAFGVYKVAGLDVSIPRRDSKQGVGHRGFTVVGDPYMSMIDAARRRDFTINAISLDPLTGEFIDPFGGVADLQHGVLRVVDARRFVDDSLRVLRACQFLARFDWLDIAVEDVTLMRSITLTDLPAERIWGEFDKLLRAKNVSRGLRYMLRLGVLDQLFPELAALVNVPQDPDWHPEGDVWTHTLQVVDCARAKLDADPLPYPQSMTVMLAALCHDFGKPATTVFTEGRWRSLGHEGAGEAPTASFLNRLNVQTMDGYDVLQQVLALVKYHLLPFEWHDSQPHASAFRRLSRKVDLMLLARVAEADTGGRAPKLPSTLTIEWFRERVRTLDLKPGGPAPLLMGRHLIQLGLEPGPHFSPILDAVFELQLDGVVMTLEQAIAAAERIIGSTARP